MAVYDERIPSTNTIKKVLDDASLVSKQLAEAQAEIDAELVNQKTKSAAELREAIDNIIEKREASKERIEKLYDQRNIVYENLLSSIIGRYYAKKIVENIENFKASKATLALINPDAKNSDLMRLIAEMNDALITLAGTNITFTVQRNNLIKKIKDLAEKLEVLFDAIKKNMKMDNVEIDENGKLKGLGHTYGFSKDFAKGSIKFFKLNEKTNKEEQLPDDFDIINYGDETVNANVEIELLKDILVEDGTEANPYLIRNMADFERFLDSDRDVYFRLETDLKISKNKVTIASNLDGNGHTLTFSSSCKQINFTGNIIGTLNVIATAKWFLLPYFFLPVFLRLTVKFGMMCSFKDGAKLNIYLDLSKAKTGLFVNPGRFMRIITVGTGINNYSNQIDFFFYSDTFKKESYKITAKSYQDDPIEERHNTKKSEINDKLVIKKVNNLDFTSESESQNTILEKGTMIKLEGVVATENGVTIIKSNEESEEDGTALNRVRYYSDGNKYFVDISNLKHTYEDKDGLPNDFYPFYSITEARMTLTTGNNAMDTAGIIQILASLALIVILKNLTEQKLIDHPTTIEKSLEVLNLLRTSLENESASLKTSMSNYIDLIAGSIHSYDYIEKQRLAMDPYYNSDFSQDLNLSFSELSGNVTLITTLEDSKEIDKTMTKVENEALIIEQNSISLTIGLVESVVLLNKTIENYLLIFDLTSNYGSRFIEILDSTSNIVKEVSNLNVAEFLAVPYTGIRQFTTWRQGLAKYTNDGIYGLGQIYIAQEFGLNSVHARLDADDLYSIILKYLVNESLIRSYKKELFLGNNKKSEVFTYEEQLESLYNIVVHLDANYEHMSITLLTEIPELIYYDNLDLSGLLSGIKYDVIVGTDADVENLEIGNLIEMIFINYLFKEGSTSQDIRQRIINISNLFRTSDKIFRNILLEYHFNKLIYNIVNLQDIENGRPEKEEIEGVTYYRKQSIITDEDLALIKQYAPDKDRLKTLRNVVQRYIAVWMFKDYIFYRAGGSVLKYFEPKDMMVYLYRREDYLMEADTKEAAFQNFTDSVKGIWNNTIKLL